MRGQRELADQLLANSLAGFRDIDGGQSTMVLS